MHLRLPLQPQNRGGELAIRFLQIGVRLCQQPGGTNVALVHCDECHGGAGLLGKDFQQQDLIFRRRIVGTDHQATLNGALVTQRKRTPPPSALYADLTIAAGLAKVPFDLGMFGL